MPATWQMDVLEWEQSATQDPGLPPYNCIWASPPCAQYSRARTTAREPRNLEQADELVRCAAHIVDALQPTFWYVENPQTGLFEGPGRGGRAAVSGRLVLHVRHGL